jgi:hypothetical protein
MKKLISGVVIGVVLSVGFGVLACGASYNQMIKADINISKIFVDGKNIEKSVKSEIKCITLNGVTYVPLRAISESLDCQVTWDKVTKYIYIDKKGKELSGWKK